ncbi:MAG: nucleotidyltransferase domain-containing protein [Cyanobium sp.]
MRPELHSRIEATHLPAALRGELLPALEALVEQVRPQGLWLFGSWARGTASRHSDVDLLARHGDAQRQPLPMSLEPPQPPCRRNTKKNG